MAGWQCPCGVLNWEEKTHCRSCEKLRPPWKPSLGARSAHKSRPKTPAPATTAVGAAQSSAGHAKPPPPPAQQPPPAPGAGNGAGRAGDAGAAQQSPSAPTQGQHLDVAATKARLKEIESARACLSAGSPMTAVLDGEAARLRQEVAAAQPIGFQVEKKKKAVVRAQQALTAAVAAEVAAKEAVATAKTQLSTAQTDYAKVQELLRAQAFDSGDARLRQGLEGIINAAYSTPARATPTNLLQAILGLLSSAPAAPPAASAPALARTAAEMGPFELDPADPEGGAFVMVHPPAQPEEDAVMVMANAMAERAAAAPVQAADDLSGDGLFARLYAQVAEAHPAAAARLNPPRCLPDQYPGLIPTFRPPLVPPVQPLAHPAPPAASTATAAPAAPGLGAPEQARQDHLAALEAVMAQPEELQPATPTAAAAGNDWQSTSSRRRLQGKTFKDTPPLGQPGSVLLETTESEDTPWSTPQSEVSVSESEAEETPWTSANPYAILGGG